MIGPRDVLIATLEDVEQADTPEDLRVIAFSKIFDMRASAGGQAPPPDPAHGINGASTGSRATAQQGDYLAAIAVRCGTDRETIAEVFDQRNDSLELIIQSGKLATQVAAGAKELALLLAGGRQAAGIEEWTSLDVVRDVCAEFKRLDSSNFSKTIRSMTTEFNVRKESERKTVVRVSRPGWEAFTQLVTRLAGVS